MKTLNSKSFPNLLKKAAVSYMDSHLRFARMRSNRWYVAHDYSIKQMPHNQKLDPKLILADFAADCEDTTSVK